MRTWNNPLQRIGVTAAGGGAASEITGGSFRDGAIIAGAQALMGWGWEKAREFTDEMASRAAANNPKLAEQLLSEDSYGTRQTAGVLPTENGSPFAPAWLDRLASPVERFFKAVAMKPQGSGLNWFERVGGINGPINRFVQSVSKVHDWMNGWGGYNHTTGQFISRGSFYDSLFDAYSAAGMAPAAVYTAIAMAPPPLLFLPRSRGDD